MKNVLKTIKVASLVLLIGICILLAAQQVFAQSSNVVIIGGTTLDANCWCGYGTDANCMDSTGGGCLPVSGLVGELGDFTFTPMAPSAVSATSLALYDTAVLNVASNAMACDTNNLSSTAKVDLIAFVASGKKLLIFDSECYPGPVDYSWMPFPFTTSNPGAMGAQGTLTIVEDNTLSSNDTSSPYYIDAAYLGSYTDAVGDMNVMTTYNANWCLDMSGTNVLGVTGPVHTYAKYPTGTDQGLIIYNGLDQDYQYSGLDDPWLRKIWVLELQQPFNPSNLPCGITVVGITLTPTYAANLVGTTHTVTANLTDMLGNPQPDILVTFEVTGQNVGATGTCNPSGCTSDSSGNVSFTYTGSMTAGQDKIQSCFTDNAGNEICSQEATKDWTLPANYPPDCTNALPSISEIWPPNHKLVPISIVGVTDPDVGDTVTITINAITQDEPVNGLGDGDTAPDGFGIGGSSALVRAERSGLGNGRVYVISFTANDPIGATCTGSVSVCVPHDQKPGHICIDDGQNYDSTVEP